MTKCVIAAALVSLALPAQAEQALKCAGSIAHFSDSLLPRYVEDATVGVIVEEAWAVRFKAPYSH